MTMIKIVIEDDHFLKIVPVILDPATFPEHKRAVADFFKHDVPDFLGWCERLRVRLPGLAPAHVVFASNQDDLKAKASDAEVVIVEGLRIDSDFLVGARRLALVQKFGTLTSNIDLSACRDIGLSVATLRRRGNIAVAEQAFALLLALAKQVTSLAGLVEKSALTARGWSIRERSAHIGYSNFAGITGLRTLHGATLGIIELGEIGREIARYARAFEMQVAYFQRRRLPDDEESSLSAHYASLDDLLAASDYVIVQLPLNESTRGLLGRQQIGRMKRGAMIINVARAELIERDAVVAALESGHLAGLALDVGYVEPADPQDPLLQLRSGNVILMPHTAVGARDNALRDMEELCTNMWRAVTGSPVPPVPANRSM